jgi:hypothetical protein
MSSKLNKQQISICVVTYLSHIFDLYVKHKRNVTSKDCYCPILHCDIILPPSYKRDDKVSLTLMEEHIFSIIFSVLVVYSRVNV